MLVATPANGDDETEAAPTAPEKVVLQFPSLADVVASPWKPLNAHKRKRVPETFYAVRVLQVVSARSPAGGSGEDGAAASATLAALLESQGLGSDFCDGAAVARMVSAARAGTEVSPVCAVMGGIIGQEVIKAISGKDKPVCNFFFFDGASGVGVTRRVPKA